MDITINVSLSDLIYLRRISDSFLSEIFKECGELKNALVKLKRNSSYEEIKRIEQYIIQIENVLEDSHADLKRLAQRIYVYEQFIVKLKKISTEMSAKDNSNVYKIQQQELIENYLDDLKVYSEYSATIPYNAIEIKNITKRSSEATRILRSEFNKNKNRLISKWEEQHGQVWPIYTDDAYNEYGQIVKKAGWKYDAHHIHPLSWGGCNTADNITPLRSDIHSDHKGVHAPGSPYNQLLNLIKEISNG